MTNILLILTDQQRYDAFGLHGSHTCPTPHLDGLARQGVDFQNAYTCTALCTPARASIFTGMLPHRHGMLVNSSMLHESARSIPQNMPTIAERLGNAGYRCGLEGKWHAGDRPPSQCGFVGLDTPGYGDAMKLPQYAEHLARFGLDRPRVQAEGVGWQQNLTLAGRMSGPVEASVPFFVAQRAIERIDDFAAAGDPFFLTCCFWGPHAPYLPCEPYASMVDPADIEPWGNFHDRFENKPAIYRKYRDAFIGEGNEPRSWSDVARWAALYFGFTAQIDEQIGRILDHLGASGMAQDTAVIFTTDHGDLTGAHGGMHDKSALMVQELYHIPMVMRLPGGPAGTTCDAMVSNLDVSATILDLAGVEEHRELDSRSLLPLLRDPGNWPDHAVAQSWGNHFLCDVRMIVDRRFKYVFHPGDIDELYDLDSDPWEMRNLIDEPRHRPVLADLRRKLIAWCRDHEDAIWVYIQDLYGDRTHCTLANAQPYPS